jgi:hypothetical protein
MLTSRWLKWLLGVAVGSIGIFVAGFEIGIGVVLIVLSYDFCCSNRENS